MNKEFSHRLKLRVYYEDTDFTGLVYHANYLRFAERGRSEYLRSLGVTHPVLLARQPPLAFVVRRVAADFHAAAQMDDELTIATRLVSARGARLEMEQKILRGEELIWQALLVLAMIVMDGRRPHPARIPADLMALFASSMERGREGVGA